MNSSTFSSLSKACSSKSSNSGHCRFEGGRAPLFEVLRRVVANLFQGHDQIKHQAAPGNTFALLNFFHRFVNHALVKGRLFGGERAKLVLLYLVGQVVDDTFVRF
ncbi:MAG: hypothetical protein IPN33_18045 [Saprospiraceae bacterium]|nr:hypothetical protein [Saprospiraceae bacterium]